MRLIIDCPLPPTLNDIIWLSSQHLGRAGTRYTKYKKAWGAYIYTQIEDGLAKQGLMVDGQPWDEVWVTADFYTTAAMDPVDNLPASLKLIMDALTPPKVATGKGHAKLGINLIKDDNRAIIKDFVPRFHSCKRGEESVTLTVSDRPQWTLLPIEDPEEGQIRVECDRIAAPPRREDRNTPKRERRKRSKRPTKAQLQAAVN